MNDRNTNLSESPRQEDAELREALQRVLHGALRLRRQAIVYTAAREMHGIFQQLGIKFPSAEGLAAHGWTRIESLSRLRAIVGGRFKNLKEKWVGAGFPLREHRGDREERGSVNTEGWLELSSWISRQGYEVRLAGEADPWLFEIRSQNAGN
jgi:hypothetical protein